MDKTWTQPANPWTKPATRGHTCAKRGQHVDMTRPKRGHSVAKPWTKRGDHVDNTWTTRGHTSKPWTKRGHNVDTHHNIPLYHNTSPLPSLTATHIVCAAAVVAVTDVFAHTAKSSIRGRCRPPHRAAILSSFAAVGVAVAVIRGSR